MSDGSTVEFNVDVDNEFSDIDDESILTDARNDYPDAVVITISDDAGDELLDWVRMTSREYTKRS
jgi:hypothetical protein